MNRMFFYVVMLVTIDMYGMNVSTQSDMHTIELKTLFPTIHADVISILNKDSVQLNSTQNNYLLNLKDNMLTLKDPYPAVSQEQALFYELLCYIYPLNKNNNYSNHILFNRGYILLSDFYKILQTKQILVEQVGGFTSFLCKHTTEYGGPLPLRSTSLNSPSFNTALTIEKATYKVHLMPTKETLLHTVHALFKLFHENPKIHKQYCIKDLIAYVKIAINIEGTSSLGELMPIIVIYIPNIFIENKDTFQTEFNKALEEETYTSFINYKKSKYCTELLLTYLVYFFNQHPECKGSGIVPRFNAKVTDMIFVAQGNGDNKGDYVNQNIQDLFTKDKVYLKSSDDEQFTINIQKVLEHAKTFDPNALSSESTSKQKLSVLKELSLFEKSFNNVPLTEQEKKSFDDFKTNYKNTFTIIIDGKNFKNTDTEGSNCILFFAWTLNKYLERKPPKKAANQTITINSGGGYFFFDTNTAKKVLSFNNSSHVLKIDQSEYAFQGLEAEGPNIKILKKIPQDNIVNNILQCAQSVYKIHLMPSDDTVLLTVYRLFELFNTNPIINKQGARLNDYINNVKIQLNPFDHDAYKTMPVIVLYVTNFFLPKSTESVNEMLDNLDTETLFSNFEQYIDYTKSKKCTEDLLSYLVYFFSQHTACKGSGIVPRFNAKVTDMIFFAQGNGDDKDYEKYFEKDKVYFKSDTGQDFKINIQQVLEQAKNFKNPPAVDLSPANEMTQAIKSKDESQKTPQEPLDLQKNTSYRPTPNINQSSPLKEPKPLQEEEPSLGIFAQISNWFKSWFYTLFQILNLGSM